MREGRTCDYVGHRLDRYAVSPTQGLLVRWWCSMQPAVETPSGRVYCFAHYGYAHPEGRHRRLLIQ